MSFPIANFSNPADLAIYASTVTGGWFWPLMLLAVWVVAFGTLNGFTTSGKAISSSSFFTGILAIFIFSMGGMDIVPALIFVALAIGGFVMLLFSEN